MMLARIEPHLPGIDERTFECAVCGVSEKVLVKFHD
jgi:single-stranded DNA-specific DHH superfamily exonuclease